MLLGSLLDFHWAPEHCRALILLRCSQPVIPAQEDPVTLLLSCVVRQASALFIIVPSDVSRIIVVRRLRVHAREMCVLGIDLITWILSG